MPLFLSAVLVLFMQAGFAALESGMSPLNNTVNIMFKNFTDLCVGVLLFYLVGYSIMYGADASGRHADFVVSGAVLLTVFLVDTTSASSLECQCSPRYGLDYRDGTRGA